jgi:tripartite-type tricarboxylate transporter receptor subunit TctC
MIERRRLLAFGCAVVAARALSSTSASAQPRYPERPIRLVIPFPPGGVNDAVGRPLADKMKALLGTIVVENQGGAGGAIGAAAVARAQPDGYTILLGALSIGVLHALAGGRRLYDPSKDLDPILILGSTGFAMAIHPSLPVRTLEELVAYAKANPGKLSYGSAGQGSLNHLTGELFKSLAGTEIAHIPYRGAGPAVTDLISGHIQLVVPSVTSQVIELHRSGQIKMLAVTLPQRLSGAPDVPTGVEAGLPGFLSQNFVGMFAPAGTPKPIVEQIAQASRTALADPELQQRFAAAGFEPILDSDPAKMQATIESEFALWGPVVKAIGLKLE